VSAWDETHAPACRAGVGDKPGDKLGTELWKACGKAGSVMRWRALPTVVGLAAVLALAGCSATEKVNEAKQSYQFSEPIVALKVDARAAQVSIATADGPTTVTETVRFTGDKPATTHELAGQTLRLSQSGCTGANLTCNVDYQIRVPRQAAAQVTTQSGSVAVHSLAGPLDVTSDAASVTGDGLSSSRTTVATKAGFVKLTYQNAPGESTVSTDAGAIELKVPGGPSYAVKITKRLGVDNVTVPQDANSPRKINIHTNVGAVTVSPS
jgi:hypothetical protein